MTDIRTTFITQLDEHQSMDVDHVLERAWPMRCRVKYKYNEAVVTQSYGLCTLRNAPPYYKQSY